MGKEIWIQHCFNKKKRLITLGSEDLCKKPTKMGNTGHRYVCEYYYENEYVYEIKYEFEYEYELEYEYEHKYK